MVALADVDESTTRGGGPEGAGPERGPTQDLQRLSRKLLEKEEAREVVIIATPDHWHSLIPIAARSEAGALRSMWRSRPGHSVRESRAMLDASVASGQVVQVGLHRRIGPHHVNAMKFLREGKGGQSGDGAPVRPHCGRGPRVAEPERRGSRTLRWIGIFGAVRRR